MTTTTSSAPLTRACHEPAIRAGLAILGATSLLTAALMTLDPSGFLDEVGGFGTANDHLVRDLATWATAYGAALLVAIRHTAWRVPVLGLGVLQGLLHAANHLADEGLATPAWKGLANVAILSGVTLVTAWLLIVVRREARA